MCQKAVDANMDVSLNGCTPTRSMGIEKGNPFSDIPVGSLGFLVESQLYSHRPCIWFFRLVLGLQLAAD